MNEIIKISTPLTKEVVKTLKVGDKVLLSGIVYTARDAGHKRLSALISKGEPLPFDLQNSIIYYVGPTPEKEGQVIGSAGPTTSGRMDLHTPALLDLGLTGMIGKGNRSVSVIDSMKKNTAVYFATIGGAAALISMSIVKSEIVCYSDLKSEAIRRLEVKDMPLTVVIDCLGNNLYEIGQTAYLNSVE